MERTTTDFRAQGATAADRRETLGRVLRDLFLSPPRAAHRRSTAYPWLDQIMKGGFGDEL